MVGIALAAGPLVLALHLIHSNVHGARLLQDRATARLVLADMVELLAGESTSTLRELSGPDGARLLRERLAARVAHMPPPAREPFQAQLAPFDGTLSCGLDEDVGGQPGLARLTVRVTLKGGVAVEVKRLLRLAL